MSTETKQDAPSAAHPVFRSIRRGIDAVTMALNVIGTLLIIGITVLVNADVIGRGVFNAPISGVPEMVSMSIVAIVFLQVAQAFRMGRLTRTDATLGILEKHAPRLRSAAELVFALIAMAVMWQLLAASTPLFVKAWERGTYEGTIGDFTAPIWPVKLVILIGCAALLVQLALTAVTAAWAMIRGKSFVQGASDV